MNNLLTIGRKVTAAVFVLVSFFGTTSFAAGDVMLTLIGISEETVIELTEEDLLALDQFTVQTENEFVDGLVEFVGPLARDVIALLGEQEIVTLRLIAFNDYAVEVPVSDIMDYDVIFALSQNGERFSIRDKEPAWVIYPMSDHEELQDRIYNDRLIWQLV
ncbi:MAG: hypothetical protein AAED33_03275 [Paracoccaceae bacterium]